MGSPRQSPAPTQQKGATSIPQSTREPPSSAVPLLGVTSSLRPGPARPHGGLGDTGGVPRSPTRGSFTKSPRGGPARGRRHRGEKLLVAAGAARYSPVQPGTAQHGSARPQLSPQDGRREVARPRGAPTVEPGAAGTGSPPPALLAPSFFPSLPSLSSPSSLRPPGAHPAPARLAGRWGCSSSSPAWLRASCSALRRRRGAHGRARRRRPPAARGWGGGLAAGGREGRRGRREGKEAAEPEGWRGKGAGRAHPGSAGDRRGARGGGIVGGGGAEGRPAPQWRSPGRWGRGEGRGEPPGGGGGPAPCPQCLSPLLVLALCPRSRRGWEPRCRLHHLVTCWRERGVGGDPAPPRVSQNVGQGVLMEQHPQPLGHTES